MEQERPFWMDYEPEEEKVDSYPIFCEYVDKQTEPLHKWHLKQFVVDLGVTYQQLHKFFIRRYGENFNNLKRKEQLKILREYYGKVSPGRLKDLLGCGYHNVYRLLEIYKNEVVS